MPSLRPPPPPADIRCTRSNGGTQCKNPRIRGELYCRHHRRSPLQISKNKKPKRRPLIDSRASLMVPIPIEEIPCTSSSLPPPPRPLTATRCTHSNGRIQCKNHRIRGELFCYHHRRSPLQISKKKRPKRRPSIDSRVRLRVPISIEENPLPVGESLHRCDHARVLKRGEIWAVPHESDGLPRAYARVEAVEESTVEVTPLKFHPISGDEFRWAHEKSPVSCGTFRATNSTRVLKISHFSHKIGCEDDVKIPSLRSFYRIFPQKDEIWAVFRECNGEKRSPFFRLVEVVIGFEEEKGVTVIGLEGVGNSKGEFKREKCEGSDLVKRFSRSDLALFSHRVFNVKLV